MRGAKLLAEWRTRCGYTQGAAAEMIGVSQTSLSDYERGRKQPRIEHAIAIERVTNGAVPVIAWAESEAKTRARIARVQNALAARGDESPIPPPADSGPELARTTTPPKRKASA